jgi:hypothetical protein
VTESDLQKKIVKALNEIPHTFAVKIHGGPYQVMGLPDIIGCYWGEFFGLEVKLPGKERTITKIQERKLKQIIEADGIAGVVTSVDQALRLITTP